MGAYGGPDGAYGAYGGRSHIPRAKMGRVKQTKQTNYSGGRCRRRFFGSFFLFIKNDQKLPKS